MSVDIASNPYGLTNAHWERLELHAVLGGWVGSREHGSRDSKLSDAISKAAFNAVKELLLKWHSEDPVCHPATEREA